MDNSYSDELIDQAKADIMGELRTSASTYLSSKVIYTDFDTACEEIYENGHIMGLLALTLTAADIAEVRDWLKNTLCSSEKALAYIARRESMEREIAADERRIMREW